MGIVGTNVVVPTVGKTPIVGTAAAELTPRLPISVDPNGIPVRAPPPGTVGDVEVGVDEEAMLLERLEGRAGINADDTNQSNVTADSSPDVERSPSYW